MRKSAFRVLSALSLALVFFATPARAQSADVEAREAEWQSYKLPASEFARFTDESKSLVFRVPVEWEQQGKELEFTGADAIDFEVAIEKIPDGIPLRSYVSAVLQSLRSLPGGPDSIITRRTQMSGFEAREIMFELTEAGGAASRRVIWSVVAGPRAISFMFITPVARAHQLEPYFKAVVQSVIITSEMRGSTFDAARTHAFKQNKPARVDEVQAIAATIDGTDPSAREKAVARLAAIFAASPDAAIDLLIDRRSIVRAAAIEAIGLSGNKSLFKFIVGPLHQTWSELDLYVFERAARAVAKLPGAVALLRQDTSAWSQVNAQGLLNATAFLDEKARMEIVSEIFGDTDLKRIGSLGTVNVSGLPPAQKSAKQPPPPARRKPPAKVPPPPPPSPDFEIKGGIPAGIPEDSSEIWQISELFNNEQFAAINLLRRIPPDRFKMPLAKIVAAKNGALTAAALEIALERRESLDVETLFKLLDSSSEQVQRYAALNLGASATEADVQRISDFISKAETKSDTAAATNQDSKNKKRDDAKLIAELRAAIKKIRLRQQLAKSMGDARNQLIKQALADGQITEWVWQEYVHREREGSGSPVASPASALNTDRATRASEVSPLGENVFPSNVKFYVALPNPAVAINRLGDSLNNLQMETARSQANLVWMLNAFKEQISWLVGAPPGADALRYVGIDMGAPIAMAGWRVEGAPRIESFERRAIVLKVSDRDRFERLLSFYQIAFGNFRSLPDNVSVGARLAGFAPAMLPLIAANYLKATAARTPGPKSLPYYIVGSDECLGYAVKIFDRRKIETGKQSGDAIYLAYVGGAAVLAPDRDSLRDALARLQAGGATLSDNAEFKRAVAAGGDVIYMSRLDELLALSKTEEVDEENKINESGALKFSNTAWENSYNLSFKQSDWSKPLAPFHPRSLLAPRELLPRSTFAYLFAKVDFAQGWKNFASDMMGAVAAGLAFAWQMDFEKDILAELGPEAGAALLSVPTTDGDQWNAEWVMFFKLRSDKLARAYDEGKLFKQGAQPSIHVAVKNGYLVFADSRATLDRLDAKEKLAAARDFMRAANAAPDGVIAFGGYNLEAAFEGMKVPAGDAAAVEAFANLNSIARAFHSQSFYAVADGSSVTARMTVSLDREGRYSVAELSSLAKDFQLTFAMVEPGGVPIADAKMLKHLKLRVKAKAAGAIERIKEDLTVGPQAVEKTSDEELVVTVRPRRAEAAATAQLPISNGELAPFLQPTREIRSDDANVIRQAREIAGDDRDALSVARKLADWTYKNLEWKRVDNATAAQTLATREADCVEFSQLFVAMARSLGLPARMVFGMAYSDGSFGGHAWVEVYAGRWVELDPTFGTDFADAGHVRGATNELISYAALNLVSIEVVEAPRETFDYQRDPGTLAEKLVAEIGKGEQSAVAASLDLAALVDEHRGAGAWAAMGDRERDRVASAYRKAIVEITSGFENSEIFGAGLRLLRVDKSGDRAEVLAIDDIQDRIVRLRLALKGEAWMLMEVTQEDTGFQVIADYLKPTAQQVADQSGKHRDGRQPSFLRALNAFNQDIKAAIESLDDAIKSNPKDRRLHNLRAYSLLANGRGDEAIKLWEGLSEEDPPFALALYNLAEHYSDSEKEGDEKKAVGYYERYAKLEPYDPRPHIALAELFEVEGDAARAEAEYRAAIKLDPRNSDPYISLAALLATGNRLDDAVAAISEAERQTKEDDLIASLFTRLYLRQDDEVAEALAAAHPERMAKSAEANLYLAHSRLRAGRAQEAIPVIKKAIAIKADYGEAYDALSECYRKLRNYQSALAAADAAIRIDGKDAEAHYERACSLARLGRKVEAMTALKRAIEISKFYSYQIADEEDLKPLALMAEFKKLLPKEEEDDK